MDRFESVGFVKGSKALTSRARFAMNLVPGSGEDGNSLVLACGKANDGPGFEPREIRFNSDTGHYVVDPGFDYDAWLAEVDGQETPAGATPEDVLDAVEAGLRRTREIETRLMESCQTSQRTVARLIERAINRGLIVRESKGVLKRGPNAPSPIPPEGTD